MCAPTTTIPSTVQAPYIALALVAMVTTIQTPVHTITYTVLWELIVYTRKRFLEMMKAYIPQGLGRGQDIIASERVTTTTKHKGKMMRCFNYNHLARDGFSE